MELPATPTFREPSPRPQWQGRRHETDPAELDAIRDALTRDGRVLVRDAHLDGAGLDALLRELSATPSQSTRHFPAPHPSASHPTTVASPALPLHRDGALIGRPTALIAFSAVAAPREHGNLETVDSRQALTDLDPGLRRRLERSEWEYRLRDPGPFAHLPDGWFRRPTFVDDAVSALNVILPEQPGEAPQPWDVRLRGSTPEASRSFFTELDAALRASSSFHSHAWRAGDLMVIDNRRTLHGIAAVPAGTHHRVLRAATLPD